MNIPGPLQGGLKADDVLQDQYADDEPAPPPDTVMLTEQQQAAAAMPPAQQQPHQPAAAPAAAPAAPQAAIQSNVFAAALAQAMGVLNQQQGVHALACKARHSQLRHSTELLFKLCRR